MLISDKKDIENLTREEQLNLYCYFDMYERCVKIFDKRTETWVTSGEHEFQANLDYILDHFKNTDYSEYFEDKKK